MTELCTKALPNFLQLPRLPNTLVFPPFIWSHGGYLKCAEKHTKHGSLAGLITWSTGEEEPCQSQLYGPLTPCVTPSGEFWIRQSPYCIVTVMSFVFSLFSSLLPSLPPLFTCFMLVNKAGDQLGIEFMGKTASHRLSFYSSLSVMSFTFVRNNTWHKMWHSSATRPPSLERKKMRKSSHHGNTMVVSWVYAVCIRSDVKKEEWQMNSVAAVSDIHTS